MVGLSLRLGEQGGADVLTAGEEHAVHVFHDRGHVALGEVLGLDLVGVGLAQHAGILDVSALDLAVGVIANRGGGDLRQLHGDTAGLLDDHLEGGVVLAVALPGDADEGLARQSGAIVQHGLELVGGNGLGGVILQPGGQAHILGHVAVILRPAGHPLIGGVQILQQDGSGLHLSGCDVGAEGVGSGAADQALGIGQVNGALILAALRHVGKGAGLGFILRQLAGVAGLFYQQSSQLATGQGGVRRGDGDHQAHDKSQHGEQG